jgi:hypothetical protein
LRQFGPGYDPQQRNEHWILCILWIGLSSVILPNSVISLGLYAFAYCQGLTTITIPSSVTSIDTDAFGWCFHLASIYFMGNAPYFGAFAFNRSSPTLYYLPWTTGWAANTAGLRTVLWLPQIQTSDGNFGVRTNQFGFNVAWASGMTVVLEAATNLSTPNWVPLQTNTLTSGMSYFSDPDWTDCPARLYRIRSP